MKKKYMNPMTGSVDTMENWLADSKNWEGDIQQQLASLVEVIWDAATDGWAEVCALPSPSEIKAFRLAAGITQKEAARRCRVTLRSWQRYESGEHAIAPAVWELAQIKMKKSDENRCGE